MADTPRQTDSASTPSTPRWVKATGIVALALVVLVVVMALVGGNHGPGRHLGGDDPGRETSSGAQEQSGGHTGPPPGVDHGR